MTAQMHCLELVHTESAAGIARLERVESCSQPHYRGTGFRCALGHADRSEGERSNILALGSAHRAVVGPDLQGCQAKLGHEVQAAAQREGQIKFLGIYLSEDIQ